MVKKLSFGDKTSKNINIENPVKPKILEIVPHKYKGLLKFFRIKIGLLNFFSRL